MSDTVIDSLVIEVEHRSNDAAKDIDALATALVKLKSSSKLTTVTNNLSKLSNSLSGLSKNSKGLGNLQALADSLNSLASVNSAKGLTATVKALKDIPTLMANLDTKKIAAFSQQLKALTDGLAPLSTRINSIATGFNKLPTKVNSCVSAMNKMGKSSGNLLNKMGGLSGLFQGFFGINLSTFALGSFFSSSITEINDYVEKVNYSTQVMGEYAKESMRYAQVVRDALGVDDKMFIDAQATFMTMAQGFGLASDKAYQLSKGMTELGYDISSFKNENLEEVFQRLQSAIAGEIEPVRRWGVALDQASMKQWMLKNGIDANVNSMTQAEKSMVRYNMLVETMAKNGAIYDMARTLSSPANALRILNQQITQLSRAIGSVFIPIIVQVVPYIQAFVVALTDVIKALALFVGFEMPEWGSQAWDGVSAGVSDTADAIGDASKKAKEFKKQLMGFDELNIIQSPDTSSGKGGGASSGSGVGLDLDLKSVWDESVISGVNSKVKELVPLMKGAVGLTIAVGAAFAGWKIANGVYASIQLIQSALLAVRGYPLLASTIMPEHEKSLTMLGEFSNKVSAVGTTIAGVAKNAPIKFGLVVTAIVLVVGAITDLWKHSESFRDAWKNVCGNISEAFTFAKDTIWNYGIKPLLDAFGITANSFGELYANHIRPITEWIGVLFTNIFGTVITTALNVFSNSFILVTGIVKGLLTGDWSQALQGLKGVWDSVFNALPKPIQTLVNSSISDFNRMRDSALNAVTTLKNKIATPINGIIGGFEKMTNGVIDAVNGMVRALNNLSFKIPSWVPALGGKKFSLNLSTISRVYIPRFEKGGFLEDGLFTMNKGEIAGKFNNGKSVVANNMQIIKGINSGVATGIREAIGSDLRNIAKALTTPTYIDYGAVNVNPASQCVGDSSQFVDVISKVISQGNGQGGEYTFVVNLDSEVVAKKVFKVHNQIAMQTGETPLFI